MSDTPTFSVLTPVFHPEPGHFAEAIESVLAQTNPDWELVLVLDGPQPEEVHAVLDGIGDARVRVVAREENGGITAASATGLDAARGTFVALLDQDDTLADFALASCQRALDAWPDADVIYSDEDKLDWDGRRDEPFCKPGFSPERLRSHMYLGHLGVYRRSLVERVGGFRPGFEGSQDHDLALRTTEQAQRVVHIPQILYHWRRSATSTAAVPESKDWAYEAGVRAVQSHMDRIGMPARASRDHEHSGVIAITPALVEHPLVSIVIPTGGGSRIVTGERVRLVEVCLDSIVERSTYPDYEILVVVDDQTPQSLMDELTQRGHGHVRVIRNERPFNFSEACNLGRDHARGEVLVFLNDDTEVVTTDWLERLVLFAELEGVGIVGAKLLYSDGRIQHLGLVCRGGGVGHRHCGEGAEIRGSFESFVVQSNLLAVTGACIAVRADRFDSVGGFSAVFPLAFNDVDLCFKLHASGFRTVFDPATVLVHHESSTRDPHVMADEFERMDARWRGYLHDDPYDNPAMRTYGFEQIQPPAALLEMRERVNGAEQMRAHAWPPG